MTRRSITLLMGLALLIGAFFAFDLHHLLTFEGLAARRAALLTLKAAHPIAAALIFFMVYTLTTGLSLPGASALALLAGALFGLPLGVALVSFASTLGATLAFLSARWLLRDAVARRWPERLALIDEGVAREGALYL
ncbi:VTT domain-containing protein, partial [Myxococcota bacterium]|nr:VTT domain-containing protein [Myxococcota bacterium]